MFEFVSRRLIEGHGRLCAREKKEGTISGHYQRTDTDRCLLHRRATLHSHCTLFLKSGSRMPKEFSQFGNSSCSTRLCVVSLARLADNETLHEIIYTGLASNHKHLNSLRHICSPYVLANKTNQISVVPDKPLSCNYLSREPATRNTQKTI